MGMGIGLGDGEGEGLRPEFTPYYRTPRKEALQLRGEEERAQGWRVLFILLVVACIVGLAMIVVGALHAAPLNHPGESWERNCTVLEKCGCPGEPMLPWYMIIGGVFTIGLVLIRLLLTGICWRCGGGGPGREGRSVGCWLGQITCITLYDIIALIITGLWLIAGTKFFIGLYSRVNYSTHRPNQDTCDFGLYWFSLVLIILGWIFIVLCIVFGILWRFCKCFSSVICCQPCRGKTML